jgi:hypothetical protein
MTAARLHVHFPAASRTGRPWLAPMHDEAAGYERQSPPLASGLRGAVVSRLAAARDERRGHDNPKGRFQDAAGS